jgi:acyl carrier protein
MGLEMVELVLAVEEEFGIVIEDIEAERSLTVGDFCDTVARLVRETGRAAIRERSDLEAYVWQLLVAIISRQHGVPPDSITRATRFIEDLGYG